VGAIDGLRQQLRLNGGHPLLGHDASTRAAAFSIDRRWLATASDDGKMRLWDFNRSDPAAGSLAIGEHKGPVHGLAFSRDGKWLVSGGEDATVRLWRVTSKGAGRGPQFTHPEYRAIQSVAFSPNGDWLVFGTESGNVCIWKMSSEGPSEAPCEIGHHNFPVTKVLFSPKGRWLATATIPYLGDDVSGKKIRLWDVSADFPRREPTQLLHVGDVRAEGGQVTIEDPLLAATFSADESRFAVANGYEAQVWDLTQQNPPQHVLARANHSQWIMTVALSPDNRWLATGSIDTKVKLRDLTSVGKEPITLNGHSATVRSVLFSDDGRWLATAGDDSTARLWDIKTQTIANTLLRGQEQRIERVLFSPGNTPEYLLTLGDDVNARLFNIPDPAVDPIVLRGHTGGINSVAVSADGEWIASAGKSDRKLTIRRLNDPPTQFREIQLSDSAQAIAFSADGRWLAARESNGAVVHLWSFPDFSKKTLQLNTGASALPESLGFSPDSRWLVSGTWENRGIVNLWDVSSDSPSLMPRFRCMQDFPVRAIAFSADGRYAVSGSHGSQAYLWDLRASDVCRSRRMLGPHNDVVAAVAISPDARYVATGSFDNNGRLWDLKSGAMVAQVQFQDRVMETAFSPDGRSVAFGSWDRTIRLLDLKGPKISKPILFTGRRGRVFAAAFSPDSKWLVTAGEDHTIRLWDLADPNEAPIVLRHDGSVFYVGFSKDGRWLITAGDDETVRLWRLMYPDLVKMACQTAGRQLTQEELANFLPDDGAHGEPPCADQLKLR
jgi:WD40 repeat protein